MLRGADAVGHISGVEFYRMGQTNFEGLVTSVVVVSCARFSGPFASREDLDLEEVMKEGEPFELREDLDESTP